MKMERIYSYAPIADAGCRILILGTMPSVKSLEAGFYYAHPRNAFWPVMAEIFGGPVPGTIEEKKCLLLENGVALWDAARSCIREGSLDSAMREVQLNDFAAFYAQYPGIERVLLNGTAAWNLYRRLPEEIVLARPCMRLPSTSPAYTMSYEKKLTAWRAAVLTQTEVNAL